MHHHLPHVPPSGGQTPVGRLLLVDDDPDLLQMYSTWFGLRGYDVRLAADGFEAIVQARETQFDVVITDLRMPGMDGLQLLTFFKTLSPRTQLIVLSGQGTMADAVEALRQGKAFDFLIKPVRSLQELTLTVENAMAARDQAANRGPVATQPTKGQAATPSEPRPPHVSPLSSRERTIMCLVAQGLDNREIAALLSLSLKTVKNNLTRIYDKLGVKRRTQAIAACQRYDMF